MSPREKVLDFIHNYVAEAQFVTASRLVVEVVKYMNATFDTDAVQIDCLSSIQDAVDGGLIFEAEYVRSSMPYRTKSLYYACDIKFDTIKVQPDLRKQNA